MKATLHQKNCQMCEFSLIKDCAISAGDRFDGRTVETSPVDQRQLRAVRVLQALPCSALSKATFACSAQGSAAQLLRLISVMATASRL